MNLPKILYQAYKELYNTPDCKWMYDTCFPVWESLSDDIKDNWNRVAISFNTKINDYDEI